MKLLFLAILSCSLAVAQRSQNSEFSLLAGATTPTGQVIVAPNVVITGSVGGALQLAYNYQARSFFAGYLYVEVPCTFTFRSNSSVVGSGVVSSASNDMALFTPGIRLKLPIQARLSFYQFAGGGVGSFHKNETRIDRSGVFVGTSRTTHGVFDVGGGLDFRLTRLLSLRGELRDFISGRNLGGASGRHHLVYELGLAFHF